MRRKLLYLFVAVNLIVSLFGVSLPVAAATITPDGQTDDWAGIPPVVNEPGDSSPSGSPDIAAAFLTHDATNLYLRMDIAQMAGGTALHIGIDADQNIATGYNTDTDPSDIFLQPHNTGIDYEIRVVLIQGQPPTATLYSVAGPTTWNPVQIQSLNKGVTAPGVQPLVAEVALPLSLIPHPFPWEFVFWVNPAAGGAPSDEAPNDASSIYPPPPSPKIAFVSDRDNNLEIYNMNQGDGSNQTRLTSNMAYDNMPMPSPDGTKIAFVSARDGNREIYVMNVDGANQTRLTSNSALDIWPAWSPDGAKIVFSSKRDGNFEIYTMNATDGSGLVRLTDSPAYEEHFPAWSSTGKIAFMLYIEEEYGEIYVMNADGTDQMRLTNNPAADNFPAWSPDGTKIAFTSDRDGKGEIYAMNADGSGLVPLTNNPALDWQPLWSPDGTKITFSTNRDGNGEVYSMDANGANQLPLTNHSANDWLRGIVVPPAATTNDASNITSSSAVVSGNLTNLGTATSVGVAFQWGTSSGNYTNKTAPQAMTATGAFSANLTSLTPGTTYYFRAKAKGDGPNFGADGTFTTLSPAGGTISGRVYQSDNITPIAGARIEVFDYASLSGKWVGYGEAQTGADGSYRVWGLPTGQYGLQVRADGYASEWYDNTYYHMVKPIVSVSVTAGQDTPNINFTLAVGGTISGHVYQSDNITTIANLYVYAIDSETNQWMSDTFTDSSGNYTLLGLPTGSYKVGTYSKRTALNYVDKFYDNKYGGHNADPVYVTAPDDTPNINFSLEIGGTISGRVYQSDNITPIAGARIEVFDYASLSGKWVGYGGATTGADGSYKLIGLPSGQYGLQVRAAGYAKEWYNNVYYREQATPVSVTAPNDTADINFSLGPAGSISGQVYQSDNITPIANMRLQALSATTGQWLENAHTNSSGNYTLSGLPAGSYKVRTRASEVNLNYLDKWYNNKSSQSAADLVAVTVPNDTPNINFSLEIGGTISGRVYQSDNITPISNARVFAVSYGNVPLYRPPTIIASVTTDANGYYQIVGLVSGNYTVWTVVLGTGYVGEWYDNAFTSDLAIPVVVTAPNDTPNINFSLEVGGTISGHVYKSDGVTPISSATMFVFDVQGRIYGAGVSGTDGSYQTTGLLAGNYQLGAQATGYVIEWYNNATSPEQATLVTVTVPNDTPNINFSLETIVLKPDLTVTEKHEQWVDKQAGTYIVHFTVLNRGNVEAGSSHVGLKIDGQDNQEISFGVLAAGASSSTNFNPVTLSGQSDNITVSADIYNMVDELNEANNSLTNTWTAKPDLTIVEKHEVWVVEGSNYIVSFTIKNQGNASAPSGHDVALFVDGNLIEQKAVPVSLAPGATYSDNFTTMISLSGSYDSIYVDADINNEVDESDETNNHAVNTFAWPPAPDLYITNKYEEWVQEGSQYQVHFTILNRGNAVASSGHDAALIIDGIQTDTRAIPVSLAPGEEYIDVFNATANLTGGMDKVKVTADINNEVAESRETNNSYENTITWPPAPDLIISSKSERWVEGQSGNYTVNFSVRNMGNAVAPSGHHVQLKVDSTMLEMVAIPVDLSPGSGYSGNFATVVTITGSSDNITVTADIHNEVAESDETNNLRWNIWSVAWQTVRSPTGILADITFADANHGWAVGSVGTIRHTSDGGSTWTPQSSGTANDLWSVGFADANNGWAVGSGGKVLHTSNGGSTWTSQTSNTTNSLYDVSFVDGNNGWAVGSSGTIRYTSNGGSTWTSQTSGTTSSLYGVSFADAQNGWAVGSSGKILHTSDGGTTWTSQTSGTTNSLLSVDFVDVNNGWAVSDGGKVLHTSDGGSTWSAQTSGTTAFLSAVDFVNANNGWVVGSAGKILRTADGGVTWTTQTSNTTAHLMGVAALSASQGWVVGESMTRLYTANGGTTWTVQYQAPSPSYLITAVDFVTPLEGWAVGPRPLGKGWSWSVPVVLYTSDAGVTWTEKSIAPYSRVLYDVDFIDANNGWAVGAGGGIIHTSNGGSTWASQTSNTTNRLRSVTFVDANNGWAVGISGTIVHTSDGGSTWTPQNSGTTNEFRSVSFVDANNGWAVGTTGTIRHTSDDGTTWTAQTSNTTNTLYGVSFVDANNGWAVGSSGKVLHTSDGGSTWTTQTSGTGNSLYSVSFADANNGWAVGSGGKVLYTSDGGSTWITQTSGTTNSLMGVSTTDSSHAWAVGDYGIIIKYETALPAPAVGVEVSINAPDRVAPGSNFTATVDISQVENFDATNYTVSFNSTVLRLDSITSGNIGGTVIPVDLWNQTSPGIVTVQNLPGFSGVSGSGYLAVLHFHVLGSLGQSSNITLSDGVLSNSYAQEIPATWIGDFVEVSVIPGDANMDGKVNAVDITKVERIIVGLDAPTPEADANLDGEIDALDITKVEIIIAGLP